MTVEETAHLVMMAASVFPEQAKHDMRPMVIIWHRLLGQLSFALAEKAVLSVLCSSSFFPRPADIINRAAELAENHTPDPDAAWAELLSKVKAFGRNRVPEDWSHPCVQKAALLMFGSWYSLCTQLVDHNLTSERNNFLRIYQGERKRYRDQLINPQELLFLPKSELPDS